MPSQVQSDGTTLIWNETTFDVNGGSAVVTSLPLVVLPSFPVEIGHGRIIHPEFGPFDYEHKPDKWVNIDGDVIIRPVWASTKTLGGAANVLWSGKLRDVVVKEKWEPIGGLSMPITMARMLILLYTNPIDPDAGYVEWWPNYATTLGFKVIVVDLEIGDEGISFDDVINSKDGNGNPDGWVTMPVTLTMKIVDRV